MPSSWSESLDSPKAFDSVSSFAGGQLSNARPRLLAPDQSSSLTNAEVSVSGQVSTRFGTAQLGGSVGSGTLIDTLGFINATGVIFELAISGSFLLKLNGGSWTSIGSSVTYSDPSTIVQGKSSVYYAGGSDIHAWDGTTVTNISGDGATQAPRNASILLWHNNRLVAAGPLIKGIAADPVVPDAIYFSNVLDATTWGTTKTANQLRVGAGDGSPIIAVVPWGGFNLAVLKRHNVYVVGADPSLSVADMEIRLVHGGVGCVARRSVCQVGSDILFLADDGIRSLSQVIGSDQQHELGIPLSYAVQDIINRINWTAAGSAAATFWRNLYILALPLDSSSTNNYLLIFNTVTKAWQGLWTGLAVSSFALREASGITRLMMGMSTTNKVAEYLDYISPANFNAATFTDYTGTVVQLQVKTRALTFNDPMAQKVGIGGELEWNNSSGNITLTPILDEVSKTAVSINVASGGFAVPFTPPFAIAPNGTARNQFDLLRYGEFREAQFLIQGDNGRKEIRQLAATAVIRPSLLGNS